MSNPPVLPTVSDAIENFFLELLVMYGDNDQSRHEIRESFLMWLLFLEQKEMPAPPVGVVKL